MVLEIRVGEQPFDYGSYIAIPDVIRRRHPGSRCTVLWVRIWGECDLHALPFHVAERGRIDSPIEFARAVKGRNVLVFTERSRPKA